MQTPNAFPRNAYTAAQVLAVIRTAPSLVTDKGLEVLDSNLNVVRDVSPSLKDGSVSRASYATLHGTARLALTVELDWGNDIVRPFYVLRDGYGLTSVRFNLGAYLTDIPDRGVRESPPTYEVDCYDIICLLDTQVGEAYSVAAGASYLQSAVDILVAQGFSALVQVVDPTSMALTLDVAKVWALDPQITWLRIVNELLGAIGYQGLWSDWDGRVHLQRYVAPALRASEYLYDTELLTSTMGDDLRYSEKYFRAPNHWVWVRNNTDSTDAAPSEGAGIFSYTNQSNGKTSVDARRGKVYTRTEFVDAADQTSLQARAEQAIAADMDLSPKVTLTTAPNPLHWHFDRITAYEPRIGPPLDLLSTQWTLPLGGGDMSHEWTVL